MVGIYKITNPKGKIYVGQSVNIGGRYYQYKGLSKYSLGRKIFNSIKKYGWDNHIHEIIEECLIEQLDEREIYWGMFYEVLGENGLNLALGNGRGVCSEETKQLMSKRAKEIMTPEHKQKLSDSHMGVPKSEAHKQAMRVPRKSKENFKNNGKWPGPTKIVFQYSLNGIFIKEWPSIQMAELDSNTRGTVGFNISGCLSGHGKSAYGYIWKYTKQEIDLKQHSDRRNKGTILQYDLNGYLIKKWDNVTQISNTLDFVANSSLSYHINKNSPSYKGFKWIREESFE